MPRAADPRALVALEARYGAVEVRQRPDAAVDYTRYEWDPEGFIREQLRDEKVWSAADPEDPEVGGTLDVIRSVKANAQTVVRGANSMGKDHTSAELALWWVYAMKGLVICTGPTQRQVDEIMFHRELKTLMRRAKLPGDLLARALRPPEAEVSEDGETMSCGILGIVSTDHSHLTGHHAPRVMCLVTEGQAVEEHAYDAMFNNATGAEDRLLVVGNPTEPTGRFYKATRRGSGWQSFRLRAKDHPNIVKDDPKLIPGGPSRQWLERVRKETRDEGGEASRFWKVFVEGQFPEGSTDALVQSSWLENAFARWGTDAMAQANRRDLVISIDPMRTGDDWCCIAPLRGPVIYPRVRFRPNGLNPTLDMVNKAEAVAQAYGAAAPGTGGGGRPVTFVVDVALMGGGVVDLLRIHGWEDVQEWNGRKRALASGTPERFFDARAWGYWELREAMRTGKPIAHRSDQFKEDMMATRYKPDGGPGGQVMIIDKKEIRQALGHSPDEADAVMMGWATANGGGFTTGGADPDANSAI